MATSDAPDWTEQFDALTRGAKQAPAPQATGAPSDWTSQFDRMVRNPKSVNYVPPKIGGGNDWATVNKALPQAAASGLGELGLNVAGMPMDFMTNLVNLTKSGAEAGMLALGQLPPKWLDPNKPADIPGTSEWLKNKTRQYFGPSAIDVTGAPQSFTAQGVHALFGSGIPLMRGRAPEAATQVRAPSAMTTSPQSLSAAAASPNLANASPEIRQAVEALRAKGLAPNPQVLERHLQAGSLPVPAQLTAGQATQDPVLISLEQNGRGQNGGVFAQHFNKQNQNLVENLQAVRDQAGPDVFSTNSTKHGDTLIEAYKNKDKAARAAIDKAYADARAAIPSTTPVMDARRLLGNVMSTLGERWATESAPPDVMRRLQQIAEGNGAMTAAEYEGLRTRLADLARSGDGSSRYAANLIRGVVEDSDLLPGTDAFRAPFDKARALARSRFQMLDQDPAYEAAVNGTVPPDLFTHRFITGPGATRDGIAAMRANLAGDDTATQTMGVATLDHLRDAARIGDGQTGNFASASFNKALRALDPKIGALLSPEHIEALRNIGDVARYQQALPKGNFVSTSGTTPALLAATGKNMAEQAVNAKTLGIGGTVARKFLQSRQEAALAKKHLAPGAGLDWQPSPILP